MVGVFVGVFVGVSVGVAVLVDVGAVVGVSVSAALTTSVIVGVAVALGRDATLPSSALPPSPSSPTTRRIAITPPASQPHSGMPRRCTDGN